MLCLALCVLVGVSFGDTWIEPGFYTWTPHWNDTNGNRIEAHGAGLLQSPIDNRWYWYGESKKTANLSTHGVNCYSAPDLGGPWTFEGQVFGQAQVKVTEAGPYVIERPKVLFNNVTRKFVMWFHLDNAAYLYRHVGIAQSSSPTAVFDWLYAMQPDGIPSLDMSLFKDPVDGQAYFIRSCNNAYTGISRLTADYLNSTGLISQHSVFEGMAIFRHPNGTYYVIGSHLTGWYPNDIMLFRAAGKTLDDPQWVNMGNPTGNPTSFNSQPTYVVSYTARDGSSYFVYLADNWVFGGPNGLIDASYVWLPMHFYPDNVTMLPTWEWDMQVPFGPTPPAPPSPPTFPPPPPPLIPRQCPPPSGTVLALSTCNASDPWQQWTVLSPGAMGQVQLRGKTTCMATIGKDLNTGSPAMATTQCSSATNQLFQYDATAETFTTPGGDCMDLTFCWTQPCYGDRLETYACNNVHVGNQQFAWDPKTSLLTNGYTGLCVSACDG